jgi:UDP-N-acetylglucosamine--N-acetylmuramyl-(pentapeptide) pyrophosphoryl-undecaprenol N-acetylglucosamine transferase
VSRYRIPRLATNLPTHLLTYSLIHLLTAPAMPRPLHIVFASGAQVANLYPGLAVAAHVVKRLPDAKVTFLGTGKTLRHVVQAAGFRYVSFPSQGAPTNTFHAVRFVTDNVAGYWASRWFMREQRVSLVVGLEGYASAAAVRAAIARGIPTVVLEQNVVPSAATRWLASSVTTICAGFAETRTHLPRHASLVITGNPARPAFKKMYEKERSEAGGLRSVSGLRLWTPTEPRPRRILVIGGADGAKSLNVSMPSTLRRLGDAVAGWEVVHQSGEGQLQETACRYRDAGVNAVVVAYIDELASVMFDSDLVVCRAAGTTLAELALSGVPAVLVPHPEAADAHQMSNAEIYAVAGAARIIDETNLHSTLDEALADTLRPLFLDEARREAMATAMGQLARPDAAAQITDAICDILCSKTKRLVA